MPITVKELILMSKSYIQVPENREMIIEKTWSLGGHKALKILAQQANVGYLELTNWVKEHYHERSTWRRRRSPIVYIEPPTPMSEIDSKEVAELAEMVAGGRGEEKFSRRNTFSSMTKNIARKA